MVGTIFLAGTAVLTYVVDFCAFLGRALMRLPKMFARKETATQAAT
jgi:hypothetical protein